MINRQVFTALTFSWLLASSCGGLGYRTTRVATGTQAMVVSAHPLASAVGERILKDGGSAVDAAVAVQFALAVVCPRAGNLGGGGFMVYAPAGDKVRTLDYREEAPSAATRDMYLTDGGDVHPTKSLEGALAAGIPGTIDGLWSAYTFGSALKEWSRLVLPAARLAREGFRISTTEADRLNRYADAFRQHNDFAFPFLKDGGWKEGDKLVQPQLAATLTQLAEDGAAYFYDGEFAQALATEVSARGGIWLSADLSDYQAVWREPITTDFKGRTVHSMPPPSSGGVALAQMLTLLEPYDLPALAANDSVQYYHTLVEAMRRAYQDRAAYLGDPDLVEIPLDTLLDAAYLAAKWSDFDPEKASVSDPTRQRGTREVYETTHTSVVDAAGNAVAITTTLNGNFGCKVWSRTGGFFLNNEMDDFSAKPGVPNQFGLVGGEANAIAPGKRMLSSMTPTIVQRDGSSELVLGSPGGSTIITAVLQVMLNNTVHQHGLSKSVELGRVHHQWLPDEVLYERGKIGEAVLEGLRARGHSLREVTSLGRVKAVAKTASSLTGAGDPRNPDDDASGY